MSKSIISPEEKKYRIITIVSSIAVPVLVAILFFIKIPNAKPLTFLPPIYATTNALTAVFLIWAFIAIKQQKKQLHERLTTISLICSVLFLGLYVAYHMTSMPTKYGGDFKTIYYFFLISHILLSIVVIPFVLITFMRAKLGYFPEHRKIAKITFPIWLYVAITGVIVYIMISPYYV